MARLVTQNRFAVWALVLTFACLTRQSAAQTARKLSGRVVDERAHPVSGATIEVVGTLWHAVSGPNGGFALLLPQGQWTIQARRLGYRRGTTELTVSTADASATIVLTLADAPSELRGVVVTAQPSRPLDFAVTSAGVREVPPLGEPDILRLLPMLPSIVQPNDLIGRLHVMGGASDEQGVYLDGFRLQSPYHVLSVLGAFDVASLDGADVSIYHSPAAFDGNLSGAIELSSRRPEQKPTRDAYVSLLSASATVTQPSVIGRTDMLASGRLSYLDKLVGAYVRTNGASDDLALPSFGDGLLRFGRSLGGSWSAQVLGYGTFDSWGIDTRRSVLPPRWSEGLVGATLTYAAPRWTLTSRLSIDRALVRFREPNDVYVGSSVVPVLDSIHVRQRWTSAAFDARRVAREWTLTGGISLDARDNVQHWSSERVQTWFSADMPVHYDGDARQNVLGTHAEGTFLWLRGTTASIGAHASLVEGRTYVAPRAVLGVPLSDAFRIELAADRRHQFDAIAEEPREGSITQPTFLLDRPRIADIVSVATTWHRAVAAAPRSGDDLGAQLIVYARRDRDRTLLEPAAAATTVTPAMPTSPTDSSSSFPAFERVPGRTIGASITAHVALPHETVVQASYTFQRVRERVFGRWQPTAWDAPQIFNMFAAIPLIAQWEMTSAVQVRSGTAITPVAARIFEPAGNGQYVPRYIYGDPFSARLPAFMRVDLGLSRVWSARGAHWALSLQVLNIFAHTNPLERDWTSYFGCVSHPGCDEFRYTRNGLPILPSLGVDVKW